MKSYYVQYRSLDKGRTLLGGVLQAQSSRFSHREDAESLAETHREIHAGLTPPLAIETTVHESDRKPELIRHCGDVKAMGSPCSECGATVGNGDVDERPIFITETGECR